MSQKMNCPQCGDPIFVTSDQKIRCLMCGWGGDGVDLRTPREKKLAPVLNKSRRWKFAFFSAVIIGALLLPSLIMFPINQARADKSISKAREQMDKKLYASAAKTLYLTPRTMLTTGKKSELRNLLIDNIRWGNDTKSVNGAKASLVKDDPESALDELSDLDSDFPLEDEAAGLIDFAQNLDLEGDLDVTDEMLDDIAFIPDDPELESLDDIDVDIPEEIAGVTSGASQSGATAPASEATPISELEFPEEVLTPEEILELPALDPADTTLNPQEEPDSADPSGKSKLRTFSYLVNAGSSDNFYSIDKAREVQPGKDRISNTSGYRKIGNLGRIYNRPIKDYEKRIIPLYRYYSAKNTDHFYSTNPKFSSNNAKANYQRQLVAGYIGYWSSKKNKCYGGKLPLYNAFNPKTDTNFYSVDKKAISDLTNKSGYKNLRVIGCIWPN